MSSEDNLATRSELISALLSAFRSLSTTAIFFHQSVAEHLGLHETDHKCLGIMEKLGPMSAGELGHHLHLTSGAITGVIDRLETAGYVRRIKDPNDRRRLIIEPISEKTSEISRLFKSFDEVTTNTLNNYTERELDVILDCVTRMIHMSQDYMKTLHKDS